MLRIQHLERLHRGLGRTEVKAMVVRMLAPAATVAWQLSASFYEVIARVGQVLRWLPAMIARLLA